MRYEKWAQKSIDKIIVLKVASTLHVPLEQARAVANSDTTTAAKNREILISDMENKTNWQFLDVIRLLT